MSSTSVRRCGPILFLSLPPTISCGLPFGSDFSTQCALYGRDSTAGRDASAYQAMTAWLGALRSSRQRHYRPRSLKFGVSGRADIARERAYCVNAVLGASSSHAAPEPGVEGTRQPQRGRGRMSSTRLDMSWLCIMRSAMHARTDYWHAISAAEVVLEPCAKNTLQHRHLPWHASQPHRLSHAPPQPSTAAPSASLPPTHQETHTRARMRNPPPQPTGTCAHAWAPPIQKR